MRNECIQMINWWLEKGLGGFRIDAILNLKKRIEYGTFPADGEDGLVFIGHWILNQPGIEEWLKEIDERTFKNIMHLLWLRRMCLKKDFLNL